MQDRDRNDRIAEKAAELRFVSRVPMLCECGDPNCRTTVMITLGDYRKLRRDREIVLTAPGHRVEGAAFVGTTRDYVIVRRTPSRGANGDRRSA